MENCTQHCCHNSCKSSRILKCSLKAIIAIFLAALVFVVVYFVLQMSKSTNRKPRHILDLTIDERREFLNSFDNIFSDIDGVVWNQLSTIPGTGEGYNALKKAGKKCVYLTNNSIRPDEDYAKRFKETGIEYDVKELVHPAKSTVDYFKRINFDGLVYCVASQRFKDYLRKAGYDVIDGPNRILNESFTDLAQSVFDREPVKAVVLDVDFNMSAPKLIRAQQYLKNPKCLLIGGATDMMLPIKADIEIIGPGPYIKVLAEASKRDPILVGKPGNELGAILKERYNVTDPGRTLMIGDMLEQDIGFGRKLGFQTLVVLTGGCKIGDFETHPKKEEIPDYYADSMKDFVEFFKGLQ